MIPNKLGNLRDAIIGYMFECQINVLSEQININPTGSQGEKMLREGVKKKKLGKSGQADRLGRLHPPSPEAVRKM